MKQGLILYVWMYMSRSMQPNIRILIKTLKWDTTERRRQKSLRNDKQLERSQPTLPHTITYPGIHGVINYFYTDQQPWLHPWCNQYMSEKVEGSIHIHVGGQWKATVSHLSFHYYKYFRHPTIVINKWNLKELSKYPVSSWTTLNSF